MLANLPQSHNLHQGPSNINSHPVHTSPEPLPVHAHTSTTTEQSSEMGMREKIKDQHQGGLQINAMNGNI